jgi:hypothetical protein
MLAKAYPEATNKGGRGHAKPLKLSTVDKSDLSRARHLQARPRFQAGTLRARPRLSVVERPGFFASASVGAITSPTKASMGVAGMKLVSSVAATLCSKRRASEKARMTTHGAL